MPVSSNQPEPVFPFWNGRNRDHTFHFGEPWEGEVRCRDEWTGYGPVFYAYKAEAPGTVPIFAFWHNKDRNHTFHQLPEWPGEVQCNDQWTGSGPIFWAFSDQVPGTVPIHDYWHNGNKDHTHHTGEPWGGEEKHGPIFYAAVVEEELVGVDFKADDASIIGMDPKVVAIITNDNRKNNVEETIEGTYTEQVTQTHSVTHKIGFKYGIGTKFTAGVPLVAEAEFSLSFEFSHDHQWSESTSHAISSAIKLPVKADAGQKVVGKAIAHQAKVSIPYKLIFRSGLEVDGVWSGTVYSKVHASFEAES